MNAEILKDCLLKNSVIGFVDQEVPLILKEEALEQVIQEIENKGAAIIIDKKLKFMGLITLQSVMNRFKWGFTINNTTIDDLLTVGDVQRIRPSDYINEAIIIFEKNRDIKVVPVVDIFGRAIGAVTKKSIKDRTDQLINCISKLNIDT